MPKTYYRGFCITRPKVMLPIANRPILEWNIAHAIEAGLEEFIIVVGYRGQAVREYIGDGSRWDVQIEYVNQGSPQGTAHAVNMVESFVDEFRVLSGDTIVGVDDIAATLKVCPSLGVVDVADAREYGSVEIVNGKLGAIHEKTQDPPSNCINAGIYHFNSCIFDYIRNITRSPRGELELTDAVTAMAKDHDVSTIFLNQWRDVGYPWELLDANYDFLPHISPVNAGHVEDGAYLSGRVVVGSDTVIKKGAYIDGPVAIGDGCTIGPNCYIRPATSIGDNCHIGHACEIKNSIIMDNTNVPHQNYVGDSVIGQGCNLGAGTKIANLRLDKSNITVITQDKKIATGRRKLGVIMGDNVQTGINAMIDVGTIIGHDTFIGPGAIALGYIASNSRIL